MTPFEALFGYPPPQMHIPQNFTARDDSEASKFIKERQDTLQILKGRLEEAANRMKMYADANRSERVFEVGDWVFLRLQPYRQVTLSMRRDYKLAPKYYGPYQILEKVGQVAYKLALPANSMIHPVFHVSLLKRKLGSNVVPEKQLPAVDLQGAFQVEPVEVLDRRLVKKNNRAAAQWLIKWFGLAEEQATWEDADSIRSRFPSFDP